VKLAVQVNGKLRAEFEWNSDQLEDKEAIFEHVKGLEELEKWIEGKEIRRQIYVPGKLVNIVI
jgi:leucyl-tRNA synthetase